MKVNAIIQARCGASRFPNKVFADIDGKPLIWHVVERLKRAKTIDDIVVATTDKDIDNAISTWCKKEQVKCYRGSEDDVLNRYYEASKMYPSEIVVRITADDPFKEPSVVDAVVTKLINENLDLSTNNYPPSFPEGLDCEAFWFCVLDKMEHEARDSFDREHVTQFAYRNPKLFKIGNISCEQQLSKYRWTIDEEKDLNMVREIYSNRQNAGMLYMDEILEILDKHPEIMDINSDVMRSTMYK